MATLFKGVRGSIRNSFNNTVNDVGNIEPGKLSEAPAKVHVVGWS
jgi:hypothetical protein